MHIIDKKWASSSYAPMCSELVRVLRNESSHFERCNILCQLHARWGRQLDQRNDTHLWLIADDPPSIFVYHRNNMLSSPVCNVCATMVPNFHSAKCGIKANSARHYSYMCKPLKDPSPHINSSSIPLWQSWREAWRRPRVWEREVMLCLRGGARK